MGEPRDNLSVIIELLDSRATEESLEVNSDDRAEALATHVPLSHCTSAKSLAKVHRQRRFLSRQQRLEDNDDGSRYPEFERGTLDDVFFYLAAVRYPVSPGPAGILFNRKIEAERPDARVCPFDTGGLGSFFSLPGDASFKQQIEMHQVALPDAGELLLKWISVCYADAFHYLDGQPPRCGSPIGVEISDPGCDERAWTFEARFPRELTLDNRFVEAVFLQDERITGPGIEELAEWAYNLNKLEIFEVPYGGDRDFAVLKQVSRAYIGRKIQNTLSA